MTNQPTLREILTRSPKALRFGTSGVRARVEDLTDVEVYCLTRGTLAYFEKTGKLVCGTQSAGDLAIPLAGDLRPSSTRLLEATAKAILDSGYQVDYCGRIPTPALTYYGLQRGIASFVVTGSHIPADRNGQKANRCDGEVLKSDEEGIVAAVEAFREQEYTRSANTSVFDAEGMLKADVRPSLPSINPAAAECYRDRYRTVFGTDSLAGWRIVFFEYSAVGREIIPDLLAAAGAEVIRVGRSDQFIPLDTEAISQQHLDMLQNLVNQQAGHVDALFSTDGDSDRPLVVATYHREVHFIPGDLLGAVVAEFLGAEAVAVPVSANPILEEYLGQHGILVRRTRIGSPYVIEAMKDLIGRGKKRVMAWEANGGFLLGSDIHMGDSLLKALPTRDAVLSLICVLEAAHQRGGGLADLLESFPPCYGQSDLVDDFPQALGRQIVTYFRPDNALIEELKFETEAIVLLDGEGREIDRWPRGSHEFRTWEEKRRLLTQVFTPEDGFAEVTRINVLDGVRCYFANREIAHVRPSGNAPQLRIYAFADMRDRAREIAELAVRGPDGLLRRLASLIEQAIEA